MVSTFNAEWGKLFATEVLQDACQLLSRVPLTSIWLLLLAARMLMTRSSQRSWLRIWPSQTSIPLERHWSNSSKQSSATRKNLCVVYTFSSLAFHTCTHSGQLSSVQGWKKVIFIFLGFPGSNHLKLSPILVNEHWNVLTKFEDADTCFSIISSNISGA